MSTVQSTHRRGRRTAAALAVAASLALTAAACTGQSGGSAGNTGSSSAPVTITFWHGWSQPNELKAINDNIAAFEASHPNIKVHAVSNVTDDKINQALRAGGANAPDVVSSFTTNNVGQFCNSHEWVNLDPFLQKDGIDKTKTFSKAMLDYTNYKGNQCALPLLGDAYGLYYNTDMFKAAGIANAPKTWTEFEQDAVKLTKSSGGSYSQLGFMPLYHGYETTTEHYAAQFGPTGWFGSDGKSALTTDPAFANALKEQKKLTDLLGGYKQLDKFRTTFGDEFSAKNPFETGQLAMSMDGEWRVSSIKSDASKINYATAPLPVADDQVATYGKGYQTGTIIGLAGTSKKQAAAWEFLKFLTTDTKALVSFANAISNVPSTYAALKDPTLDHSAAFQTFLDVAANPNSNTTPATPNGGAYLVTFQNLGYKYESGQVTDLNAALKSTAAQIDADLAQAQ
ncbi:multiple sugar transport system substrate-binding protein [Streptacidiphilus sp. MAP12-20]|uniref:ABC transporter substrate-binding protein n=1 Tax=Streptacidiphilus sp. MAP12-20 TaxID=3156299 RepID=UPI003519B9D9